MVVVHQSIVWCCLFAANLVWAPGPTDPTDQEPMRDAPSVITTQAMLGFLDAMLDAQEAQQLTFEATHYYGTGSDLPPAGASLEEYLAIEYRYSAIKQANKYRMERTYIRSHDNLNQLKNHHEIQTFNGAQARSVTRVPEALDNILITLDPPNPHRMVGHFSWLGYYVFQLEMSRTVMHTYASLLRDGLFVGPELAADGTTRWRCLIHPHTDCEVVIYGSSEGGRISISAAEFWIYTESTVATQIPLEFGDHVRAQNTVAFQRTGQDPDRLLPEAARFAAQYWFRSDEQEDFWGICDLHLLEVVPASIDPATFLEPIGDAEAVINDARYGISYTLGTSTINLDGRLVTTHEPLHGDVGARLEWWIEHATLGPVIDPETGEYVYPRAEHMPDSEEVPHAEPDGRLRESE
jgi:hypothetical protein